MFPGCQGFNRCNRPDARSAIVYFHTNEIPDASQYLSSGFSPGINRACHSASPACRARQ